jgi:hypothetical protein
MTNDRTAPIGVISSNILGLFRARYSAMIQGIMKPKMTLISISDISDPFLIHFFIRVPVVVSSIRFFKIKPGHCAHTPSWFFFMKKKERQQAVHFLGYKKVKN